MNNKSLYIKVIIDNYINSLLLVATGSFTTLNPFLSLSFELQLFIIVFCAIVSVFIFAHICIKEEIKLKLLLISLVNVPLALLFTLLNFSAYTLLMPSLPVVELNTANGIYIMFSMGLYLILSVLFRFILLVWGLVKLRGKKQSGKNNQ